MTAEDPGVYGRAGRLRSVASRFVAVPAQQLCLAPACPALARQHQLSAGLSESPWRCWGVAAWGRTWVYFHFTFLSMPFLPTLKYNL